MRSKNSTADVSGCYCHHPNISYIFILPEEAAWESSTKQCLFGNLGALDRKAVSLLLAFKGTSCYSRQFLPYNQPFMLSGTLQQYHLYEIMVTRT